MKIINQNIFGLPIVIILLLSACTISKKATIASKVSEYQKFKTMEVINFCENKSNYGTVNSSEIHDKTTLDFLSFLAKNDKTGIQKFKTIQISGFISPNLPDSCDEIILSEGGKTIKAKYIEIKGRQIRFSKCEENDGDIYYLYKSEIKEIRYSDGSTEKQSELKQTPSENGEIEGFGMAGFVASLLSIFIALISFLLGSGLIGALFTLLPFSIISIGFGAIGVERFYNNPSHYNGKIYGMLSWTIGIVLLIIILFAVIL